MHFKSWSAALLIGLAVTATGYAQAPTSGRIRGVVQAAEGSAPTRTPVAGATVRIVNATDSTVTDEDGHFFIGPLPIGRYELEARCIGYLPLRQAVQVSGSRFTDVVMRMSPLRSDTLTRTPVQLQAITITAAPVAQENPATTITVPPLVITQIPAINTYDILRQGAGIEVHDQGQGPGFASNASIRGFSSDHSTDMALWVDGVPINEPVNGHSEGYNDWSLVFPQAIEAADVIKGPTSPVYGNFAMAGVVNMRTLEHMHGVNLWANGGAYERFEGAILAGWENPQNHGVVGVRGVTEDGWRPNSAYKIGQVHGRFVQKLSSHTSLDAGVEVYGTDWSSPGFLSDSQFQAGEYDVVANPTDGGFKRRGQERLSFRVVGSSSVLWRTTLYATQGRWQLYLTTPPEGGLTEGTGSQTEEEDFRHGYGGTSALTFQLPQVELTVGAEGRWDGSHYQNWFVSNRARDSAQTDVNARQLYGGAFVASTADLGHHFRLNLGARLDGRNAAATPAGGSESNATTGIISPKLGALYHLPVGGELYANVSRGFRQTDGVVTDPALGFITEWAYETGFKIERNTVNGSIAFFRMNVSNEQSFNPITLSSSNGGESRRQGIELGLRGQISHNVQGSVDWTFQDAKYLHFVTQEGDTLDNVRVFNTARYVGSAALDLTPGASAWNLRVSTNVVGPYSPFDEPGVVLPAYALFHVAGGFHFKDAQIQVGIRNLFDTAYPELRAGGSVVPGQPRTIFAQLRYDVR